MDNPLTISEIHLDTCSTRLHSTQKVVVALSGGVDSSVAAWLLKQQGYQVEGVFMKNWEEDDNEHYCAAAADLADVTAVCDRLAIPLHTINFAAEYWEQVFETFLAQYQTGCTPNPDILCNKEIKFKAFLTFATQHLKADFIATGHYVRKNHVGKSELHSGEKHKEAQGGYQLLRGLDPHKDQSYFLYALSQQQLAKSLFPLGPWQKPLVRRMAQKLGLITADKKESMGICFIGQRPFRDFLARYLPAQPGLIASTEGVILGQHQGVFYYTLGQRQGLGIGGTTPECQQPWYVVDKDLARNVLIVAQGQQHPLLQSSGLLAEQLHWITPPAPSAPLHCSVKVRYRQQDTPCHLIPLGNDKIEVRFQQSQTAVTPGQAAVFYQGEICLGGALITQRLQS